MNSSQSKKEGKKRKPPTASQPFRKRPLVHLETSRLRYSWSDLSWAFEDEITGSAKRASLITN